MLVAGIVLTGFSLAQNQEEQSQNSDYTDQIALAEALRRGGLREAARIKGNYVEIFDPHWDIGRFNIEQLTKNSEVVAIGIPVRNRCRLSPEGLMIMTDYEVVVQETIKGYNIRPGDIIKVSLPGGKIMFQDQTTAEVQTPDFMKMANGKTYALFLNEDRTRNGIYILTAGPQGLLELPIDGTKVKSHARSTDPVFKEAKDKDVKTFLKEVRKQAKKWPTPSKCCD
jgi:hypothetical protein